MDDRGQVRTVGRWSLAWRVLVSLAGIALLLNGSLLNAGGAGDRAWPFGPLSQYADSHPQDEVVLITRVEGRLADGRRIDLPLRVGQSGISRSEIEDHTGAIVADPSLLRTVVEGWTSRHPDQPAVVQVWLVNDRTPLTAGRAGPTTTVELAGWLVPR